MPAARMRPMFSFFLAVAPLDGSQTFRARTAPPIAMDSPPMTTPSNDSCCEATGWNMMTLDSERAQCESVVDSERAQGESAVDSERAYDEPVGMDRIIIVAQRHPAHVVQRI